MGTPKITELEFKSIKLFANSKKGLISIKIQRKVLSFHPKLKFKSNKKAFNFL